MPESVPTDAMIQTFAGCIEGATVAITGMMVQGVPWFRGNDVAAALSYKDPRKAVARYVADNHKRPKAALLGREKSGPPPDDSESESEAEVLDHNSSIEMWIDEPGVYALAFGSKKPGAAAFRDWVYSEVLPSIRRTGTYTDPRRQELDNERLAIENRAAAARAQQAELDVVNMARQALLAAYGKLDDAQEWAYHDRMSNVIRGEAASSGQELTHAGLYLADHLPAAQVRQHRAAFGKICARRLRAKLGTHDLPKARKNVDGHPCDVIVFRVPQDLDVLEAGLRELRGDATEEASSSSAPPNLQSYFRSRPY
jgi:prophage antirepressor-like protein